MNIQQLLDELTPVDPKEDSKFTRVKRMTATKVANPTPATLGFKGRNHTKASKAAQSIAQKQRMRSDELLSRISAIGKANQGRKHTPEAREKMRLAAANRLRSEDELQAVKHHARTMGLANKGKPKAKGTCLHCGKLAAFSMLARWHNENCRQKVTDPEAVTK